MAGSGGQWRPPLLGEPPYQPSLSFLTQDELFNTSDSVKSKVLQILTELSRTNVASENQRRSDKIAFEQQIFGLENELRGKVQELEKTKEHLSSERQNTENYVEKYRTTLAHLNKAEEQLAGKEGELSSLKTKNEALLTEKDDLLSIIERRSSEIEKLTADLKTTNDHLQAATAAKCDALVKVDELTSLKIELDCREKQLDKEKEWVSKQVSLLQQEIDKQANQKLEMQRSFNLRLIELQNELGDTKEKQRIERMQLDALTKTNEEQEHHIERLLEKLKEAQERELKEQEQFRQELKSQSRLAELYKESSDEASKKVEELEDAVTNLQALLRQAADKYGELETHNRDVTLEWESVIADQNKVIADLKEELADANELLANIKQKGMTDEMIASLSPAAAAASAMLKESNSLTEIYSRHQKVYNELLESRDENKKLNAYVQHILKEISDRAPGLRRQKEEFELSLNTIEALQNQLDLSLQEISDFKIDNAQLKKSLSATERENLRLNSQIKDMSLQIRTLLREVESNRGNYSFDDQDTSVVPDVSENSSEMSAARVITDRLVTFRSIEEMQAQNQHLLTVVRELSEAHESAEKDNTGESLKDLKASLANAENEIQQLKESKSHQDSVIESLSQERQTLKILLNQQRSPMPGDKKTSIDSSSGMDKIRVLETNLEEKRRALETLQEDFDTYRREKSENDKITNEQIEKLRDDVLRMRSDNARLACQNEYNTERAKNYTANLESYKKNIAVLEEKSKQHQVTIMKHEHSIEIMKNELSDTQHKLATAEVSLITVRQERDLLRDAKARLEAECDLYKREHSTQQMLQLNLEEIKNGLEMANAAVRIRLENQVNQLQKENEDLRRMHDTENSKFKDTVLTWDKTNKDLQLKVDQQIASIKSLEQEIADAHDTIRSQRKEIEELLNKANLVTGMSASNTSFATPGVSTPPSGRSSAMDGDNYKLLQDQKIKDLNIQLSESQLECKSLKQQLETAKNNAEEYKSLAEKMELHLNSANSTSKNFSDELSERLACKDDIIRDIQARLDTVEKENATMKEERETITRETQEKSQFLNEEINRMRRELQAANSKLQNLSEENCTLKDTLAQQSAFQAEMKEKLERELSQHEQDVKSGGEMKAELDLLKSQVDEANRARKVAEESLASSLVSWSERENAFKEELGGLQRNLAELEALNISLQDQLIALTSQINSLRKAEGCETDLNSSNPDSSLNASLSESDLKQSDQWLQLVRYLRREKDIAKTQAELAQQTTDRLATKVSSLEKQNTELQQQLTDVLDKSQISVMTSAKQADLLRKLDTLDAMMDSNRMLREEKEASTKEIVSLQEKLRKLQEELTPLQKRIAESDSKCETLNNENTSLREDAARWRQRSAALLEKCNKVNPEEMKKLQNEKDSLQKMLATVTAENKKQQQEVARLNQQIKNIQQSLNMQQSNNTSLLSEKKQQLEEHKKISDQLVRTRTDLDSSQAELANLKQSLGDKDTIIANLKKELEDSKTASDRMKLNLATVKSIAKKYKKSYEDLVQEQSAQPVASAAGSEQKSHVDRSTCTEDDDETKAGSGEESLRQDLAQQQRRVAELSGENDLLKRDIDKVRSDSSVLEERAKSAMKRLNQIQQQKAEMESDLNECKTKLSQAEEANHRLTALKSQLEGKIAKIEKESKDSRPTAPGDSASTGAEISSVNTELVVDENNRMKKELEMLRPRVLVLEKQLKLHTQHQSTKGSAGGADKMQVDPPKANIKPIAGTSTSTLTQGMSSSGSRPPLTASIRPMSMPRKATVMPTAAAAAVQPPQQHGTISSQPQPFTGTSVTSQAMFVAPVSQAQVSTSTPDQSTAMEHAGLLPATSSATTPVVGNSAMMRQATVQPTPAVTVTPISTAAATGTQLLNLAGPSGDRSSNETGGAHEDPSTSSNVEDSELGDSSEQVSSSEPSSHQQAIPVAPIRSQQEQSQVLNLVGNSAVGGQGNGSTTSEEPSPSTSTAALRPSQSSKRGRENEAETSLDQATAVEPDNKRSRMNPPIPVDREAEAMFHHQEEFVLDNRLDEGDQEADQGGNDEDIQDPHSRRTGSTIHESPDDDDSDVIVIDSDDDDEQERTRAEDLEDAADEEEEDLEDDNDEEEDDEEVEEEDSQVESGSDVERDDHDDDDEDGVEGEETIEDINEELDSRDAHQDEEREAESMEGQDDSQNLRASEDEADAMVIDIDDDVEQLGADRMRVPSRVQSAGPSHAGIDSRNVNSGTVELGESSVGAATAASVSTSSYWGSSGNRAHPVPVSRQTRQDRAPALNRHHQLTPGGPISSQFDDMDESIVPSTPTLFVQRRTDGFAEAVSSPQVQPQRFTFSQNDSLSHATIGIDDSRADIHDYDNGSGRSVPTTPLQISPPETVEVPSAIPAQGELSETEQVDVQDVQPSSSDSSRFPPPKISEVPSITVTYAGDASLDSSPYASIEAEGENSQSESETHEADHSQSAGARAEVSVTSSDEDKLDGSSSAVATHHSTATSSSGTASPTPSSNNVPQQISSDSQLSQHHRVRPTPIVWDQPTSSSSTTGAPPRAAMARRGPRAVSGGRPLSQPVGEVHNVLRGGFRPLRGPQQSARRSGARGTSRGVLRPPFKGPFQ